MDNDRIGRLLYFRRINRQRFVAERQSTSCGTTSSTLQVFFHPISAFPYFHAWIFHVCRMFFFIQTMAPEGAELIKHIPAFK